MAPLTEMALPGVVDRGLRAEVDRLIRPEEPRPSAPAVRPSALLVLLLLSPATPKPKRR
ncbi:hypothetical protein Q5530_12200 [Saccharothrix sp. BKS2]|uniref:hypothetical protein n=1 Tax=Saccharothrix sp. BKS2 TaxID=3064400 RepID=UPI0039E8FF1E